MQTPSEGGSFARLPDAPDTSHQQIMLLLLRLPALSSSLLCPALPSLAQGGSQAVRLHGLSSPHPSRQLHDGVPTSPVMSLRRSASGSLVSSSLTGDPGISTYTRCAKKGVPVKASALDPKKGIWSRIHRIHRYLCVHVCMSGCI